MYKHVKMSFWKLTIFLLLVISFGPVLSHNRKGPDPDTSSAQFQFTQSTYNASVLENSMGSTLVTPTQKIGVWNEDPRRAVKFEITDGDPLHLFKVEAHPVGIFAFCLIRVNNNERSLNRELKSLYQLRIRATLYDVPSSVKSTVPVGARLRNSSTGSGREVSHLDGLNLISDTVEVEKVVSEISGDSVQNDDEWSVRRRLGPTTDRTSLDPEDWPTLRYENNKSVRRRSGGKSSTSRRPRGRSSVKSLRRSLRDDEKRPKLKNRNRSGERRKNRKEKQIFNPIESKLPERSAGVATTVPPKLVSASPPLAVAESVVYVAIEDADDNVPIYEKTNYDVSVVEDIPILAKITKIIAVDADVGRNQEIYYSLTEWNPYFAVDPILGVLSPTRPLIGMAGKRHHVRVRASNRWSAGPAAETTANISIRPANRHSPQIDINRPPEAFLESRPYGVIYAVVTCRDNDEGENGLVDLSIKSGDPDGIFRVTPTKSRNEFYIIMSPVVAKGLKFKGHHRASDFHLTLQVMDGGQPARSSQKELHIKVPESQWATRGGSPLFDKDLYEVEMSGQSPPHSVVFRFTRPDPRVTLSISSGNEGEEFMLEKSGVLYTAKWLETGRTFFTLTVDSLDLRPGRVDQAHRGHRSAAKIVIKLISNNVNAPKFDDIGPGNSTEVYITESEPVGTLVKKLHARDLDEGENGYVTYSMANLNNLPFTIDHFTGEIRSTQVLDYETSRRVYFVRIRATDWGSPFRRESEIKLKIKLAPHNDHRPLFSMSSCIALIDRSIKFETEFGRLAAMDFDSDPVTYKIVGGNSDNCFSIDSSGSLRVMCDLRDYRSSARALNVTASDGEYYSDVMTIKVELRDTLRTNFNKSESTRSGIKLYSTSQSVFECKDTGVQERYDRMAALSEENNKVDESDWEEQSGFSHYAENVHLPHFLDFPNEIQVNESVAVGARVLKLRASDKDKGYNGFLTFVISNGDESHGAWDIVTVETTTWTGETVQEAHLIVARPLNREEFPAYTLNITVFDQGKPPKHMSKLLPIKILDANDCRPVFEKSAMKIELREGDELVGETIAQFKAYDDDEEGTLNSVITYRLLNASSRQFAIDEKSGKLRLLAELDREAEETVEVLVVAEDGGVPKLSSTALLTIKLTDVNDNAPYFQPSLKGRVVKIREDWPIFSVVTQVSAQDRDLGLAGLVRHALVDGSRGDFILDEISGVIRVNKKLDYHKTSMYNLTIRARDQGDPVLSADTFVVIEIYDVVKEKVPRLSFPEIVTLARIKEDSPVGTRVAQITPTSFPQSSHAGVYFSLEGTSLFNIDNAGVVRNSYELDYENQPQWHYITIVAMDVEHSIRSFLVVELQNINDCVPLTREPIYKAEVEENLEAGYLVLRVDGFDCDNTNEQLRFSLRTTNVFFEIDAVTGEIKTLVSLDREQVAEHTFDVIISDMGEPSLNSSTKILVTVLDTNDHSPTIFGSSVHDIPELRNEVQGDEPVEDADNLIEVENEEQEFDLKWSDWQMLGTKDEVTEERLTKLYRVVAYDPDAGLNGSIQYRLKYRINTGLSSLENDIYFSIHPQTGEIYTSASIIKSDTILKFIIEVRDNDGSPQGLSAETELTLRVKRVDVRKSSQPPLISPLHKVSLTTREKPGYTVETLEATDPEGDQLWYEIVSGDAEQFFTMYPDSQNLILTRSLSHAKEFKLNVSVSDGVNTVFTQLLVKVVESEHVSALIWEQQNYTAFIYESVPANSVVTTVRVNASFSTNWKQSSVPVLYGFHNAQDSRSLRLFSIDSVSGSVSVATSPVDREALPYHIITVKARDSQSYSFVRLLINVLDVNDKAPVFGPQTEVRIPETLAVGSLITQVFAYDADSGDNGVISYSITYGNIGSTFELESTTGHIFLKKPLSIPYGQTSLEYALTVKAADSGDPSLSSTTNVNVIVSLPSDNQVLVLRCGRDDEPEKVQGADNSCVVRVKENSPPGTYVTTVWALNSPIGVNFEIDEIRNNVFWINSASGVILVGRSRSLDREIRSSYELNIKARNAQGVSATCKIKVEIQDVNDNFPSFTQLQYSGHIREDAPLGTLVTETTKKVHGGRSNEGGMEKSPLIFRSVDYDSGINALVTYSIIDEDVEEMRKVFYIDPTSGALLLVTSLDYEKRQSYAFQVKACDFQFCDSNLASVNVSIENVNDQEPVILSKRVELFLPTIRGVVHTVEASDPDGDDLKYSISRGNFKEVFSIEENTGKIVVEKPENVTVGKHVLEVSVSDGRFSKTGIINIIVKLLESTGSFGFENLTFEATAVENSTKVTSLLSLHVLGTHLNENLQFSILNPSTYFGIIRTSGVIFTTGKKLDREQDPLHNLLIEVRGDEAQRISRCFVKISVTDVNDNVPNFVGLPYIAVVLLDSKSGDSVITVKAVDLDLNENGMVRYELVRSPFGDIYDLNRQTGEVYLRRRPDSTGDHELIVRAYDAGIPSLQAETQVQVKIVTQDQPVFEHQFYETWLPESAPLHSTALAVVAVAKNPIIYSIEAGNEQDAFGVDYQTGILYVNAPLDFETIPIHSLKIRATDLITSSWSSTMVLINLRDSNDNRPVFEQPSYVFLVTEGEIPLNGVVGQVKAFDKDTVNSVLTYEIVGSTRVGRRYRSTETSEVGMMSEDATSNNRSLAVLNLFLVKPNDGLIVLKQPLDYEQAHDYYFSVSVRDSGIPFLSSTARVRISVQNINNNSPKWETSNYYVKISEASQGMFVAKVTASDSDMMDTLRYSIVGNYRQDVFDINKTTGIVTLAQPLVLQKELNFSLNISVTDGVFTSYARLHIEVQPKNHFVPSFDLSIYEVLAPENSVDGFLVTTLTAVDRDRSIFGQLKYSFADMDEPNLFEIDEQTGQVRLSSTPDASLDREDKSSHNILVVAQDGGGWMGYTKLVIKVSNMNDWAPTFPVLEYRVNIPAERMRSKTPVLQCVATDSDSEFGIRYSILDLATGNASLKRDSQYFEMNAETGEVRFKLKTEDLPQFDSQSRIDFQFWVRADDGELHSSVPVTVVVLPASEPTPEINPQNATFFVKEDASVGSMITTFRVSNIENPRFRVVSSNEDVFQVDRSGNLLLNAKLDEDEDKHTVVIWAESLDGLSVATSQVTVRVLATKDNNKPKFNRPEYVVRVAEDFPEGSLVFTARAADSRTKRNIKERYELLSDNPAVDLYHFAINQEHGWISLVNKLDYEKNRQHILQVLASDSENPLLMSTTRVVINVLNVDDEPTLCESSLYHAQVREDAAEGTIVETILTVDLDEDNGNSSSLITPKYLAFYIIEGDEQSHFKVNERGQISIWRRLDAEITENYELTVLVTDGFNEDYTKINITVVGVNDNVPICPVPEYSYEISESASNYTYITVIEAYDADKESRLSFSLSGNGSEDFRIDEDSGLLSVGGNLDREGSFPMYSLTVHAKERDSSAECTVTVTITLLDTNDNKPIFGDDEYKFFIKEDSESGALVGKVNAQDKDLGVNGKVRYLLLSTKTHAGDLVKDQFDVDSISGVITLLRPLDREIVSQFNLSIQARDSPNKGPILLTVTHAIVQVLDINDHAPEFLDRLYSASVSELIPISTEVIKVVATSKDEGINAEITYDIVGGNGYHHWAVDPKSGQIFANASLDFERIREYVLTLRARDGPPENQLASQCTVNITVLDENDNNPQFQTDSYSVSIPEDLPISTSVIQISAADLDSGINAKLRYEIGNGDPMKNFVINATSGMISVVSVLDREMVEVYTIEVVATDSGSPPRSSSTMVEINILDVNDNQPFFNSANYTAIVQEDRVIGFRILTFEVNDLDAPPNSSPFSWDLRTLEEDDRVPLPFTVSDSGDLLLAGKLNFQRKSLYRMQVVVFDNGSPPLQSSANVTIQVVDKSQWPPVVSALSVTAITLGETYPAGILGLCHASDFDNFDVLTYSLLKTKSSSFFTIDHSNGTLKSLTPLREGTYELGIIVSDGRWSARGDAYVKIISLASLFPDIPVDPNQAEQSAGTNIARVQGVRSRKDMNSFAALLTVKGHNPQSLLNRMFAFTNVVKEAMSTESNIASGYEVVIFSVQSARSIVMENLEEAPKSVRRKREEIPAVDVLLAVRKSDGSFVSPLELVVKLRFALPQLEAVLSAKVIRLTSDICTENACDRGTCRTLAAFEGTQSLITTETLSLITPNHYLETICMCPPGYGGSKCEKIVNACAHSECNVGYVCVPDNSAKGYACLCRKTHCPNQQAVAFSGMSYLSYNIGPSLERDLSISIRIKTMCTAGTLLYTFGEYDYAILEINQGLVQFSWDLGAGKEVLTITSIPVSDNRWHHVVLQLRDNHCILRVNERSTSHKGQGARLLHTKGILHIGASLIGTGAVDTLLPSGGFIGCMKDLRFGSSGNGAPDKKIDLHTQEVKHYITPGHEMPVDPEDSDPGDDDYLESDNSNRMLNLPLHTSTKDNLGPELIYSRNISFSCERTTIAEACKSLPCKNGGTCIADDSTPKSYRCTCHPRFHGLNCEIDLEPCVDNPCSGNGKCHPSSNSIFSPSLNSAQYYCQCNEGTHGTRCEKGKFCKSEDTCNSRGECEEGPVGPICFCEKGFTGQTCQLDVNECEHSNACAAGSTCINFVGSYTCICASNASGIRCTKLLTPSIVTNDYQIVILIFAIVLSFIILLIIFIFARRCCIARERSSASNSIPLTTQVKLQDNRIPIGRDNREQILRNRDSKISNLEIRPVSAGSEIFQADRGTVDPIKSYGSAVGDEKPPFINNLMKPTPGEKRRCGTSTGGWESNRDYPKIQNYMKPEINWGTKGKTSSPMSGDYDGSGYQWDPDVTLPPPPDIPDSVSVDSNSDVLALNLSQLPPEDSEEEDTLVEQEAFRGASARSPETTWPIPHPNEYLLPHHEDDELEPSKPVVRRNRYQEKSPNNNLNSDKGSELEDEINENCSLLCGPAAAYQPSIQPAKIRKGMGSSTTSSGSPQKVPLSSPASSNGGGTNGNNPRKLYSKTTHITEV